MTWSLCSQYVLHHSESTKNSWWLYETPHIVTHKSHEIIFFPKSSWPLLEDTPFSSILACGNLPKAATEFFLWSLSEGTTLRIIESSLFAPDAKDKKSCFNKYCYSLVSTEMTHISRVLAFIGRAFVTMSFGILYLFSSELYPTSIRYWKQRHCFFRTAVLQFFHHIDFLETCCC